MSIDTIKLKEFYERGAIRIQNGFAYGNWNDSGKGIIQLRPFNISINGQIDLSTSKYIEINRNVSPYLLQQQDIIFNNTNSEELVGKTAFWVKEQTAVLSNHMTIVRVLDENEISPQFLAFLLLKKWMDGYFHQVCRRHVNQASVSVDMLKETPFPFYSVLEQRRIASILNTVQTAIEQQERLITLTRELKSALMHKLFTEGLRGEKQKETEIGLIPESWQVVPLGKYVTIKNGYSFKSSDYVKNGVLSVRISNVSNGELIDKDNQYLPNHFLTKYSDFALSEGDLIISLTRPVISSGIKYCLIEKKHLPLLLNQRVGKFEIKNPNHISKEFLYYIVSSKYFVDEIKKLFGNSSQQPNVSPQQLEKFLIPLPMLDIQNEISFSLNTLTQKVTYHSQKKKLFEELLRSLLNQLMTGQIRVDKIDLFNNLR